MADWGISRRGTIGHLLGEPAKGPFFRSRCQPKVMLKPWAGGPVIKCQRCAGMEGSQPPLQTPREVLLALLAFVDSFCREHGFGPTARELTEGLGVSSSSVAWWRARAAARLGWLDWEPGKARTLRLTEAGAAVVRGSGNGQEGEVMADVLGFKDSEAMLTAVRALVKAADVLAYQAEGTEIASNDWGPVGGLLPCLRDLKAALAYFKEVRDDV